MNNKISILNKQGILFIEEPKCNFDVEIGREIQKDFESNKIDNYILWSADSDFANPIKHISNNGKQAIIFATSRKVSKELDLTNIFIFDVKKIKEFICWKKEIPQNIKKKLDSL